MAGTLDICGLDLTDRDNLDPDMKRIVKGIVKKYGFMPHFIQVFSTDNQRLKSFLQLYTEVERSDAGLTHLEHEMIALVSAATNGCVYCTSVHAQRFAQLARIAAPMKIIALGGLTRNRARTVLHGAAYGWAGIDAFLN